MHGSRGKMRLETRSQIVVVKSEEANKEFNLKEYHDSFLIILEQLLVQAVGRKLTSRGTSLQSVGDDGESDNGEGQEETNLRKKKAKPIGFGD